MTTIETWQARLDSVDENYITTSSDVHITMQCEIDELRAEVEQLTKDALRYRTVLGMSSDQMLRLYNTRFDLREQFIDAAMQPMQHNAGNKPPQVGLD